MAFPRREVWGEVARIDPLENYFTHFFEEKNMIDIEPI